MILGWIMQNKAVTALSVLLFSFFVATIALAVEKNQIQEELDELYIKYQNAASTTSLPETTITQSPSTESQSTVDPTEGPSTEKPAENQVNFRLAPTLIPIIYQLHLNPDLNTGLFSGSNNIILNVTQTTKTIALHSKDLIINGVMLRRGTNGAIIPNSFVLNEKLEQLVITLNQEIPVADDYELTIAFGGSMLNRIVGLYSSTYLDEQGNKRFIATSKFEPTFARQAFPCFDEPAMKAKFEISLVCPKGDGYHALSNMNEMSTEAGPTENTNTVNFAVSVPMSTYLAAFIVSDFTYKNHTIETKGVGNNFEMRVFATPAQLNKVDFALDSGVKITEYYVDYFQVEYPLPKLDMVAIPDFVSGAMEHWGLVTFRETALLYDNKVSSTPNKQRVATVVAHELAHMWFGNLVTMAWWDELWLNEGFASYIQYKGTDAVYPEWKLMEQFLIETVHGVMNLDATLASHPIVQTADTPDQITELFDSITYSKGASIIRMLEQFVGPENFRKSVSNYLRAHQYGNAVTDDLLTQIDLLDLGIDVKYIMSTWTKQTGLPVVNVEKISATQYKLTQKRFLSNPASENVTLTDSEFNYRWFIPITYATDNEANAPLTWFNNRDIEVTITVPENHKWIKLNTDQVGYYRVNYNPTMWQSLTNALLENHTTFSISNRAHLLNDAFSLAEATQLEYSVSLELTRYLANETDYVPWSVASSKIAGIGSQLYYTDLYPKFSAYGRNVITGIYKDVGWTVDTNNDVKNLLRTTVLGLACSMGIQECIDEAGSQFNSWILLPDNRPSPDLRSLVYYYGMQSQGDENKWNQMWKLYLSEQDAQEKAKLMYGLSGVQNPGILRRFIELAWSENNVRGQDYFTCIQYIAANRNGESLVWDYVRENWQRLVDRFGLNERYLGRLIPSITSRFSTELKLQEVRDFFAKFPEAGAGAAAREQALDRIQNKIQWLENNQAKIGEWLDQNY